MKNRIVMSAMTRGFADSEHCCTEKMSEYYERRAKNGIALILTEGIIVDQTGDGYNNVPYMKTSKHAGFIAFQAFSLFRTRSNFGLVFYKLCKEELHGISIKKWK